MTKPRNPLFSFNVRGSLAHALTFARRHRQQIAEAFPTHPDAKTAPQLLWRTMYQQCTDLWHTLSPAEKVAWESSARRSHMTGYAYYMSLCLRPNPGIYLPLAGGTMSGNIDMSTSKILNLPSPAASEEPIRKSDFEGLLSWQQVAEVIPASDVDYVDFTSLDINTDKYYFLLLNIDNASGAMSSPILFVNTDYTEANYTVQLINADGAAITAARSNTARLGLFYAGKAQVLATWIFRDLDGYVHALSFSDYDRATTCKITQRFLNTDNTFANLTKLRVTATIAGTIGAGSILTLFRPRRV